MIILRILIFIYGALTLLAVGEEITKTQFNSLHVVYIALSLALIYVAIQCEPTWLLYIALLGLLAFAIWVGLSSNTLQWSHIVVRTIISVIMIVLWNYLA